MPTPTARVTASPRDDVGAAVGLDDAEAEVEALLDALDMADDTDGPTAGTQFGERVDGEVERIGVKGAEALVHEQAVDPDAPVAALDCVGEAERQGERR